MNNIISFHSLFLCVCVFVPVYFAALYWNRRNDRQHNFVKQQNLNQKKKKKKMEKGIICSSISSESLFTMEMK